MPRGCASSPAPNTISRPMRTAPTRPSISPAATSCTSRATASRCRRSISIKSEPPRPHRLRPTASKPAQRALVIAKVEIFVRRGRGAAPGAEHVGAQLQHIAKAVHVELRVNGIGLLIERNLQGTPHHILRELQTLGD